jgi:RNA recognition motif-containing protein
MANKSLYVGNLSYSVTETDLRNLFAPYQPADVRLIGDKGFGFVDVPEDQAAAAITALNGREISGRQITVNEARPKSDRGGGERRGGGGGGFGDGGRRW